MSASNHESWDVRFHGRMRLADLINGNGAQLAMLGIQMQAELDEVACKAEVEGSRTLTEKELESFNTWMKLWQGLAGQIELRQVSEALARTSFAVGRSPTLGEVRFGLRHSLELLESSLREISLFIYSPSKSDLLYRVDEDWESVFQAFADTKIDVRAGVDLYCLGHHTASVFQMMRVLERGLQSICSQFNPPIPFANDTWHEILKNIEAAVSAEQKKGVKGARAAYMQFLSEAVLEFRFFKDAWRNHVSHAKVEYDEYQARGVIEHVRRFMILVAKNQPPASP